MIAARLTEARPDWKIILIEQGPDIIDNHELLGMFAVYRLDVPLWIRSDDFADTFGPKQCLFKVSAKSFVVLRLVG